MVRVSETREYYLTFISIVFGIFIAVWAQPIIDMIQESRNPGSPVTNAEKNTTAVPASGTDMPNGSPQASYGTNTTTAQGIFRRYVTVRNLQGFLTLVIIVCLWWWYGIFLRSFAPAEGFVMYLYDFWSLGAFAVASGIWTNTAGWFAGVVFSSMVLIGFRFFAARKKTRKIPSAYKVLNLTIGLVFFLVLLGPVSHFGIGVSIGKCTITAMFVCMCVTIYAVFATEGLGWGRLFVLGADSIIDRLIDPSLLPLPGSKPSEWTVIDNQCQRAMREFEEPYELQRLNRRFGVVASAVHSSNDFLFQSKLAVYAAKDIDETIKRVQMMCFVHWFDDIMDQQERLSNKLSKIDTLNYDAMFSTRPKMFSRTLACHKKVADKYRNWFNNKNYFDAGVVRLVLGGRIFKATTPTDIHGLRAKHKDILLKLGISGNLLTDISSIDEQYIDLTVKTVMEFWFGIEHPPLSAEYAFLYSLLYGPALYYHDCHEERKAGELHESWGKLDENKTVKLIQYVVDKIEALLSKDSKAKGRAQEVSHFVLTFSNVLPTKIRQAYETRANQLLLKADKLVTP